MDSLSNNHPTHVLWRKLRWKSHWAIRPHSPVNTRWWGGMRIVLPHSGSAATVFYRTFPSEAIARWMIGALRPGMTVIDVGAHVGVYSLLAAQLVGEDGVVHAVEPQHALLDLVAESASLNNLANIVPHSIALSATDGMVGFDIDERSMGGRVVAQSDASHSLSVTSRTLDSFCVQERIGHVNLVKLDAAGNEYSVLEGASDMLDSGIDCLICKLYNPEVIRDRFGAVGGPHGDRRSAAGQAFRGFPGRRRVCVG